MDNSTFSIWEQESFLAPRDIVIIGGGLVGLWSAWYLKQANPHRSILLLEKGLLPSGASTRNAGFACFGSPGEILRDMQLRGHHEAMQLVEMRFQGLELLQQHFPPSVLQYEPCGGYECFHDGPAYEEVRQAMDDINLSLKEITGYAPVFSTADKDMAAQGLRGFDHLLWNPLEAALHSGKLMHALTQKVQGTGLTLLSGTSVTGWEETSGEVLVHTNQSFSISCQQLLICTNGFARELLPMADVVPARGQILLTAPIPGLSLRGTFHYDEGFYYFRHLGDRILLGGARNEAISEETTPERNVSEPVQQALETFLHRHLLPSPDIPVTHRWAGIMGMGGERQPLIEQVRERVFCAVRLSGVGVAISPLVGKKIAGLMALFLLALWPFLLRAQSYSFGVKIFGHGRPMILIPGLKGDGEGTWKTTVDHFRDRYTCYVVTLAGFAGQPPTGGQSGILGGQRDELLRYIREQHLVKPVLVGFSFGGVLALWMDCTAPDLFGPVIDIDGVPFEAGLENPAINKDTLQKQTFSLLKRIMAFTPGRIERIDSIRHTVKDQMAAFDYLKQLITNVGHIPDVIRWDIASDIKSSMMMELEIRPLDLRGALGGIKSPLLVLGSWKGYHSIHTQQQAEEAYGRQFAGAPGAIIHFSAGGRHFLMWDDYTWMCGQMDDFLNVSH
jgi:gamma-glutamylputrescine oxidase